MTENIDVFHELNKYKEQHPDFAEVMQVYHEVMPIYRETMQIMRDIELALSPYTIDTKSNTESWINSNYTIVPPRNK